MSRSMLAFLFALMLAVLPVAAVAATPPGATVEVIETWPAGDDVVLAPGQNFHLRLRYASPEPVGLWVRPYFRGAPANAGSNPSARYQGRGEALGWFFLFGPDDRVDEIRVQVGDGRSDDTVAIRMPVRVRAGAAGTVAPPAPAWVATMAAADARAQREAMAATVPAPSAGDGLLLAALMLGVVAVAIGGGLWPLLALWRWRGGWRIAAALPAVAMAFVVIRIGVDTARHPTSHNLWPFELLIAGAVCSGAMALLALLRRVGRRRAAA